MRQDPRPTLKTIGVIAPSGIFNPQRLEESVELLREWGHTALCAPNLAARHLCCAGTAKERLNDLEWALDHPDIDLIWCARGGYGSAHLIPALTRAEREITKPILGFSDLTALGVYCANHGSTQFIHAPVLHSLIQGSDETTRDHARRFVERGALPTLDVTALRAPRPFKVTAPLVGGNLCVLTTLMGTPYQLQTAGRILMLEDVAEPPYKIHRMLTQLSMSGSLDQVSAIVFGTFTRCLTSNEPRDLTLDDLILDALADRDVPLYHASRFGHDVENDLWRVGHRYTLTDDRLSPY